MKLLAVDTSGAACSAALWANGAVISSRRREMFRGQAEALMPMAAEVMREARMGFAALDLIAVTIGPGSFTGLRTGLAAARGIALAQSIPLIGVTTTEVIALAAGRNRADGGSARPITVVLNSRRDDLYAQHFFADLTPVGEPFAASPEDIARSAPEGDVIFAGDATARIVDIVRDWTASPDYSYFSVSGADAEFVAEVAVDRWSNGKVPESDIQSEILYLRAPDAVRPAEQGRLRQ